jgi:formimidoylglutamate deiminase
MYALVQRMDVGSFHALCLQAFREMLASGITTVGEFHYLHHDGVLDGYVLDRALLAAAREAGIRIAVLNAFYKTGGIGQPLSEAQRRFRSRSAEQYWDNMDELADALDRSTQSLGCVVHSIRAADLEDLQGLAAEARARGMVVHMHVEEQRREIDDCLRAYGRRPLALVNELCGVDERFTAVHCTHSTPEDLERFVGAGGGVCIAPLTEGNLGDGIADVPAMLALGARISVGTDSNARIDMLEELRWLEYVQRLARERRGVCLDPRGDAATRLFRAATEDGARSLGLPTGVLATGAWADFQPLDLDAPALAGAAPESLLAAWIFGAGPDVIAEVCVGGRWRAASARG